MQESPTSVFAKAVKKVMEVGQLVGFSKEEIQADVRDLKERYKDNMLGPRSTQGHDGASSVANLVSQPACENVSKRRKFEPDADESADDEKARHNEVAVYLAKTCGTDIFLRSTSDPELTKMVSLKNDFQTKSGTKVTMFKRQTGSSKTYKCQLDSCAKLKTYHISEQTQAINGHNKGNQHMKGAIELYAAPEGWQAVPWSKVEYKDLRDKHKLARTADQGDQMPSFAC